MITSFHFWCRFEIERDRHQNEKWHLWIQRNFGYKMDSLPHEASTRDHVFPSFFRHQSCRENAGRMVETSEWRLQAARSLAPANSLTAGAGTRCMSLLSSSPSLQTVRSVLGDEGFQENIRHKLFFFKWESLLCYLWTDPRRENPKGNKESRLFHSVLRVSVHQEPRVNPPT